MCQREKSGNKQLIKAKPDFFPFFFFLVVYMFLVLKNGIWQQQQNSLQKEIRYLVTLNSGQIMARYLNSFDYMEKDGHKYYINHINMRQYCIFGIKT